MLSYQLIFFLHRGQKDRPFAILIFLGIRQVSAAIKEPIISPVNCTKKNTISNIFYYGKNVSDPAPAGTAGDPAAATHTIPPRPSAVE